ncbi:MAG: hypothetical protein HQ558_07385 [Candidatus Omnitrophica bacterium]|nr:hypothetical protein [Candidatus Omnitrophota bacterium]
MGTYEFKSMDDDLLIREFVAYIRDYDYMMRQMRNIGKRLDQERYSSLRDLYDPDGLKTEYMKLLADVSAKVSTINKMLSAKSLDEHLPLLRILRQAKGIEPLEGRPREFKAGAINIKLMIDGTITIMAPEVVKTNQTLVHIGAYRADASAYIKDGRLYIEDALSKTVVVIVRSSEHTQDGMLVRDEVEFVNHDKRIGGDTTFIRASKTGGKVTAYPGRIYDGTEGNFRMFSPPEGNILSHHFVVEVTTAQAKDDRIETRAVRFALNRDETVNMDEVRLVNGVLRVSTSHGRLIRITKDGQVLTGDEKETGGARDIPFQKQPEARNCAQTNMKIVLDYLGKGEGITIQKLEQMTGLADPETGVVDKKKMTWTIQNVNPLIELGLDISFRSSFPYAELLKNGETEQEGREFLNKYYGTRIGNFVMGVTVWPNFIKAIKQTEGLKSLGKIAIKSEEDKRREFAIIEKEFRNGANLFMLVDRNYLDTKQTPEQMKYQGLQYAGHFVIVTHITDTEVWYHDTGREDGAHRKISKDRFIQAWCADGTDNDVIIIRGIKKDADKATSMLPKAFDRKASDLLRKVRMAIGRESRDRKAEPATTGLIQSHQTAKACSTGA